MTRFINLPGGEFCWECGKVIPDQVDVHQRVVQVVSLLDRDESSEPELIDETWNMCKDCAILFDEGEREAQFNQALALETFTAMDRNEADDLSA